MADVDQRVSDIRQAVYGEQVREALASGIEAINDEVITTTSKADEAFGITQNLLDETFDASVITTNFGARLDTEIQNLQPEWTGFKNETDAQLAQTAYNVTSFGAIGDRVANDTTAINNAINFLTTIATSDYTPILKFPYNKGYLTTEPIIVPRHIQVIMEAPIFYSGEGIALTIGVSGVLNNHLSHKLSVVKSTQSDWIDNSTGILIINANTCNIEIVKASNFENGYILMGDGGGCAYNNITERLIVNNKFGKVMSSRNGGWCNENIFIGGRYATISNINTDKSRYGIKITSENNYYQNNNVFLKPSFELLNPTNGEALPILIEYGLLNTFESVRNENNSGFIARIMNESTENEISSGYGNVNIDDLSVYPLTITSHSRSKILEGKGELIFNSGDLSKKIIKSSAAGSVFIAGVVTPTATDDPLFRANITPYSDHIEVRLDRHVGIYVDTTKVKEFVLRRSTVEGNPGRCGVKCYGFDDVHLTDLIQGHPHVKGSSRLTPNYNTAQLGGSYETSVDNSLDLYFKVGEETKKIFIYVRGGTSPLKIKSFSVTAIQTGATAYTNNPIKESGLLYSGVKPYEGKHFVGQDVFNYAKSEQGSVGSKYIILGWSCIVSGEPGTWVENRVLTGN